MMTDRNDEPSVHWRENGLPEEGQLMMRTLRLGLAAVMAGAFMLGSAAIAPSAHAYIEGDGKGKPEADCFVGLEGYDEDDLSGYGKKAKPAIQCTDCDPSCDLDGVAEANGSCTFSIAVRVNDAGDPICTPAQLKKIAVKAKTKGTKITSKTSFQVALDGSSVTSAFVNFPVLTKKFGTPKEKAGTGKVSMSAKKLEKPKLSDKDKFLFVCNPLPAGESCPAVTTTTVTSTTTTTIQACAAPGPSDPTQVLFTNRLGASNCGGAKKDPVLQVGVWTDGSGPFSGQLLDESDNVIGNLGLSCLYLGGGAAFNVPPGGNPDNGTNTYTVTGVCPDGSLELGPDAGTGKEDCTVGPETTSSCIHTLPPSTSCTQDGDCAGGGTGACAVDANCFFGGPLEIANGGLSTCVINAIMDGVGGSVTPSTGEATISMPLQSRVYLTGNPTEPCPHCVSDVCDTNWRTGSPATPSPNSGDACSTTATSGVSHDCAPAGTFVGRIAVDLTPLTTGSTMLESTDGNFCPGQVQAGIGLYGGFGLLETRKIIETGSPAGDITGGPAEATLASTFCIPATGNVLIDGSADLPGPGATSLIGDLQLVTP